MSNQEFSDSFDTLLNSYSRSAQFGEQASKADIVLDEFEKSVLLTKAQEELVIDLYTGKNAYGDSFESSEEVRRNLASLVMDAELSPETNTTNIKLGGAHTTFYTLPDGSGEKPAVWYIVYEEAVLSTDKEKNGCKASVEEDKEKGITGKRSVMEVVPVTHDEYHKIKKNPFRGPNSRRALRLDLSNNMVEIICKYDVSKYCLRYITKPSPIILTDLGDNLEIRGEHIEMPCKLHESLHDKILERAVLMAIQSRGNSIKENK